MDVYQKSGEVYPGGNPLNVAVYLRGLGAESAYIGWVGSDQYSEKMVKAIQEKGADISHLSAERRKNSCYLC